MSSGGTNDDRSRLRQLVSAAMDATADEQELRELSEILRSSAEARDEYLTLVDLHAVLATQVPVKLDPVGDDVPSQNGPSVVPADAEGERSRPWLRVVVIAALAASLLIAIVPLTTPDPQPQPQPSTFTSLVQATDAKWASTREADVGDRFGQDTIRLVSGFVRFEFDSGVEVTLQGPAEFELISPEKTRLASGLLTANVPQGAEGFTVDTPTAEVIDLGTSFGIDLRDDGFSNVSVFDGEVEVAPRDADERHLLSEGESIRIGADRKVEEIAFDPQPFEKLWPISSGIVGSTQAFRFVPPWPKNIKWVNSDSNIFVATEGYPVRLGQTLQVNISEPGEYTVPSDLTPLELPSGTRVRSFLLHHSPAKQRGLIRTPRVSGSITFDRPVLGLIIGQDELRASSRRFSRQNAGEADPRRKLELTGGIDGDRVTLSEDRKTVTLDLVSPGRSSDLVRVIVESAGRFGPPPRRLRKPPPRPGRRFKETPRGESADAR